MTKTDGKGTTPTPEPTGNYLCANCLKKIPQRINGHTPLYCPFCASSLFPEGRYQTSLTPQGYIAHGNVTGGN